jgi:hypothetical protein
VSHLTKLDAEVLCGMTMLDELGKIICTPTATKRDQLI